MFAVMILPEKGESGEKMVALHILGGVAALAAAYVLFLLLCSLFVDPSREYDRISPFYRRLLDDATAIALKLLRIKVHVTGMEHVPRGQPLLFVGNHRSNFDPIVTWYAFRPWQIAFVSKPENFKIPIFGRFIRKCGFMAIDRQDPRKAIATINRAAALLEQGEACVGVYPEGTRSKSGQLLPFHNGVFKIAKKAEVGIVVLAVSGTEEIHKRVPFRRSDVYLDVRAVIPAEEVKRERTEVIGQQVRGLLTPEEIREKEAV